MSKDSVLRLLVVGDAPDEAEQLSSLIRAAGHAPRTERVETPEELADALDRRQFDILVHMLNALDTTLEQSAAAVNERGSLMPIIAVGNDDWSTAGAMRAGAVDRSTTADTEHLRRVLIRELGNVRARRQARDLESAYRESEQRARALMATSRDAIAYIHAGMHVLANDAYLERFGYQAFEELEGTPMMDMVDAGDRDKLKEFLRSFTASEEAVGELELTLRQQDGSTFAAQVEFSRASIEGEACSQIIIRDPGNTEELERQLDMLSRRESLTGLYNRQYFMQLLEQALGEAEKEQRDAALVLLQIDEFDELRKNVGVLGADSVIASIGGALAHAVGTEERLARVEGPTYALLTEMEGTADLEEFVAGVREQIKDHICEVDDRSITVTVSAGMARIDGGTTDPNEAHVRAERALSEARRKGANSQHLYTPKPGEMSQKELDKQWAETIRHTLENDRLRLLYQPIVSLTDDATPRYQVQVEVLDDQDQPLDDQRTHEMFAAAERTGMARGLDRWVIQHALNRLKVAQAQSPDTVFYIPLSGHAFDDAGLFRWINDCIRQIRINAAGIVFEADAGAAAYRMKKASAFSRAIHKIGCSLCLSNFGHGNEPFLLLRHVDADVLRIGTEFMERLDGNPQNQDALRELASEARSQGKMTICPGVADASTMTVIFSLGPDLIQGAFLQPPMRDLSYDFSTMAI